MKINGTFTSVQMILISMLLVACGSAEAPEKTKKEIVETEKLSEIAEKTEKEETGETYMEREKEILDKKEHRRSHPASCGILLN